jgi:Ca-activated chloride channel homolog
MASCAALAAAGGGRVAALHRPSQAPNAVRELLG